MCGIVGLITKQHPDSYDETFLSESLKSLKRRGPDDSGFLKCHINGVTGLLGHTRLSILDLSHAGHQPMSIENEKINVIYNGEIYNFKEIRNELQDKKVVFKSTCDTEVIPWAYKYWGEEFVKRLNGIFAIVLWDALNQKLLLYRDRLGVKPLFCGFSNDNFYFGSTLYAIAKVKGFNRVINRDALQLYTFMGYVPDPFSMFEGIKKISPGSMVCIDFKTWECKTRYYWRLLDHVCSDKDVIPSKPISQYIDEMEELLLDSVKIRMISDVPIGAFLSGGIDSSLVVALMTKVCNNRVKTFSIGFDVEDHNEAPMAKAIAEYLGTEHHELILTSHDIKNIFCEVPNAFDEPFSDSSCLPSMLLSKMTREYVTVALSGDGGDEQCFGDYRHYAVAKYWDYIRVIPPPLRKLFRLVVAGTNTRLPLRISDVFRSKEFGDFMLFLCSIWDFGKYKRLIKDELRLSPLINQLTAIEVWNQVKDSSRSWMEVANILDFYGFLPDDFLVKVDRASMYYALEVREPVLDYRIAEYAKKIPLSIHRYNNEPKFLLRSILERYLPKHLWDRPKQGFKVPLDHWFRTDLYEFLCDHLLNHPAILDYYDKKTLVQIIADHKNQKSNNYRLLWGLLSYSMWHDAIA